MIIYIAQKYFLFVILFSFGLMILPIIEGAKITELINRVIFYSGIFSGIYIYYSFKKNNFWTLYDNLNLSKFKLLAYLFLLLQFFNLILILLI